MSKVQKVSIALTPEMNALVQEAVASGQYASASEVVRDALRFWQNRERVREEALAYTRALIQEGINSGPSDYKSMAEIIAEARKRREYLLKKSA